MTQPRPPALAQHFPDTHMRNFSSLELTRFSFDTRCKQLQPPADMQVERVNLNGVSAMWAIPEDYVGSRTLVYVHGGGFVLGSAEAFVGLAGNLALQAGARALILDYRLAPEHPFPSAREDILAAYHALLGNGIAAEEIVFAGDSSGANLILSLLEDAKCQCLPLPAAALLISPWVDLSLQHESFTTKAASDICLTPEWLANCASLYLGEISAVDPRVSVLQNSMIGLPPMMIQVGSNELLLDDSLRLARHAGGMGVRVRLDVWPNMFHLWHNHASELEEGDAALLQGAEFLAANLP
ncbi:alpha/beta hydrolase [Pseudomonas sp. BN414]|nr:alpha/beta hydrolase [Pseudomonas sp. BN414]MDH4568234.1 alpha/beta hydrolase [Pseudomonas sp. BN414]NWL77980.1 alpha/beta hydrolase [Pseudomonas taiwanensis]